MSNKVSDGRVIEEVLQHLLADLGGVLHIQAVQQVQCVALKTTQPALQQLAAADHLHTLCTHSTHCTLCTLYTLHTVLIAHYTMYTLFTTHCAHSVDPKHSVHTTHCVHSETEAGLPPCCCCCFRADLD